MHKVQGVTKLRCPSKNKLINEKFDRQTVSHDLREGETERERGRGRMGYP